MEYIKHDSDDAVSFLSQAFADNNLIPIIGAGFTVGCKNKNGSTVPSGDKFKEIMIAAILENNKDYSEEERDEVKSLRFNKVADIYFNSERVPKKVVEKELGNYFYNVQLDDSRKEFLNSIEWPYIYTLNIDDAIENNSNFKAILPYNNELSESAKDRKCLFKLHGDIYYELTHNDERMVFKSSSYLASIEKNRSMLEILRQDLVNKNIAYIGCGVDDEVDIAFLMADKASIDRKKTRNIIFSSSKFSRIKEQNLIDHGIDLVVLHDPMKYNQIYELFYKSYQESARINNEFSHYKKEFRELSDDKSKNKSFMLSGVANLKNKGVEINHQIIPYYKGKRDKEKEIFDRIDIEPICILYGKRISGRTQSLYAIANEVKYKSVYFIESYQSPNEPFIKKILGQKDSLIIFDSSTIDQPAAKLIYKSKNQLKDLKTSVIVVIDYDHHYMLDTLAPAISSTPIVEIKPFLSVEEAKVINKRLINVGLPTFNEKKHLLDNLFRTYNILGEDKIIKNIDKKAELFKILCIIGIQNHITFDFVDFLKISQSKLTEIIDDFQPYLDSERIKSSEKASHTGFKIICNSHAWLYVLLGDFYRKKGIQWCCDELFDIAEKISPYDRRFVNKLSMFDSINALFSHGRKGAAELILRFYVKLEALRKDEPEFYVQKAKAYYNMYYESDEIEVLGSRVKELNVAKTWAETDKKTSTVTNILHTRAIIALRIASDNDFMESKYILDSVKYLAAAFENKESNSRYVSKLIGGEISGSRYLNNLLVFLNSDQAVKHKELLGYKSQLSYIKERVK